MRFAFVGLALAAALVLCFPATAAPKPIPPAFGPYVHPAAAELAKAKSFRSSERIVGTYYFYWYNIDTGEHITNPQNGSDGLTDHPATTENFSYRSVAWHKKQLSDMEAAGIDLALMVFWGAPSEQANNTALHWSYAGLPPLVEARDELLKEGKHPPRIGLFYDTSTLQYNAWHEHVELTTDYGRQWFYATVRDFYSMIPARHWAMIDEKPVVLLYASAFAKAHDQSFVDFAKAEFKKEFSGRELYLAPQDSWHAKGDSVCAWGGALGMKNPGIGELGPGYDDSAVYGRTPLIQKREDGEFYARSWTNFLRRPSNFVTVETWSEFHEGTDICESKEYGRQYIDLTKRYSGLFKRGWQPEWPKGRFTGAKSLVATPSVTNAGLTLILHEDGKIRAEQEAKGGKWVCAEGTSSRYVYFKVDDTFKWAPTMTAGVEVEYEDLAPGKLRVDYDGEELNAPLRGAYTRSAECELNGDGKWKRHSFELKKAHFLNSQNSGADFRLVPETTNFAVRKVSVRKR